jgi:hypothetical protein
MNLYHVLCFLCVAFIAASSSLSNNSNYTSWMGDNMELLAKKSLNAVLLPGSHDAASYHLTDSLAPQASGSQFLDEIIKLAQAFDIPVTPIIKSWAQSQNSTLYQQAAAGIRYFDLRACYNGSDWVSFHFVQGLPIRYLLSQLQQFVIDYPTEIVVIEVSHFLVNDAKKSLNRTLIIELRDMLIESFGSYLILPKTGLAATFEQLINTNQRVLIAFDDDKVLSPDTPLWHQSLFRGAYSNTPNVKTMINYNTQLIEQFTRHPNSTLLSHAWWTLTSDFDCILAALLDESAPQSLKDLAVIASPQLLPWAQHIVAQKFTLGNIIIVDWIDLTPVMQLILEELRKSTLSTDHIVFY